jgi:DNA repair exonuclease SbcCD ATPase subunit
MADKTDHRHEIEGEWFAHDHEGGDRPHRHVHTEEEVTEHHEAVEEDGTCPVCGEVHELDDEEVAEAEAAEHAAEESEGNVEMDKAEEHKEPESKEPEAEPVMPPQVEEEEEHRRRHVVTSAWHAHRMAR